MDVWGVLTPRNILDYEKLVLKLISKPELAVRIHGTAQHSTLQRDTARHGTAWHDTARHGTAQNRAPCFTALHGTAQHGACHDTA